jgi:DNA-binding response OmpR family regulator
VPTILFVSPEAGLRTVIGLVLREEGYRVLGAGDGLTAVHLLESESRIDLAITATRTPVLNGWQFARVARQLYPCLPILRITADSEERTLDGMVELPLLEKPFTVLELVGAVRALLMSARDWPRCVEPAGYLRCTPPPRWRPAPEAKRPARQAASGGSPLITESALASEGAAAD